MGVLFLLTSHILDTIREGIIEATRNALYCSQTKRNKVSLADVKAQEDRVVHKAQKRPHIEEMVSLGRIVIRS